MKGISPMVATVLLIGFTVAVGSILAIWFSTYTKTQTSSVGSATACASTTLDVKVPSITADGNVTVLITNNGPGTVNITSVAVTCSANTNTDSNSTGLTGLTDISPGVSKTWVVDNTKISGCTYDNVAVDVRAVCKQGGVTSGACPAGTCHY